LSATFSVKHVTTNGGSDGHIITTPLGGLAPYSFLWTGNGLNTNTKDVYNLSAGTYSLLLNDNAGCSNRYSVKVNTLLIKEKEFLKGRSGIVVEDNEKQDEIDIFKRNYLSINEMKKEIRIFPNPNSGIFTVSNIDIATILLYNTLGVHVKTFEHISKNETINISDLTNGIYFLKIIEGNTIKNEKIILNK
jgi:hypothetical protein